MGKTKIEWSQFSWNPVTGCTPCSLGCAYCYAERMARRLAGRHGYPKAPHHFDVTLHPGRLDVPLRRRKPTMYFVCSMSDLFHESVPDKFISRVWRTMLFAGQHTFQILTKRPRRMESLLRQGEIWAKHWNFNMPLPNVWLGVSIENQAAADERIPYLLQTPAAVHYVSVEPYLSAVDLSPWLPGYVYKAHGRWTMNTTTGHSLPPLSWVICGSESGPGARPMDEDWVRDLRDQCQTAGVSFFYKQQIVNGHKVSMPTLDGRTWQEFPR
jgi:protein gp37